MSENLVEALVMLPILIISIAVFISVVFITDRMPLSAFFRTLRSEPETFKVFAKGSYDTFVVEGVNLIPVEFYHKDRDRLIKIVANNQDYDVYVKAKIDPKTLSCTKLYGYTLKPKEEAE
jgi:hypothetical protein